MEKRIEKCESCRAFLNITTNNEAGECRLRSPSVGGWPKVLGHSWCLEYVSKKINLDNQYRGGLRYTEDGELKPRKIKLTIEGEALRNE